MQQRMQRLEWIFNHTMDQLRKDLDQASKRLNDLRASALCKMDDPDSSRHQGQ
ncbi:UNVERIFIED_CONTAM: hypothetical protein FKN15_034314 [Acipenser sinensis]